jgi:tryptophan synthase alpha chain
MSQRTNRLDRTFAALHAEDRLGLFPYLTAGYPDRETCARLLEVMAENGADGFELGIPFSDPLADGVTMQRASARALEQGITLGDAFDLVASLRRSHDLPIVMMSYANPLMAYGIEKLCDDSVTIGVDGFIVPDLPLEEAEAFGAVCAERGLHYVYMLAPTSNAERVQAVGERASGFIYCVALVGVTGARTELSSELGPLAERARAATSTPLVAGFGISTPEHVASLHGMVDGAIVSSAIADRIERAPAEQVESVVAGSVRELRDATRGAKALTR